MKIGEGEEIAPGKGRTVQRRKAKKNAFGPAMQKRFFETLAQTANVRMSADAAGVSMSTVYRRRQKNLEFRVRWDEALDYGYVSLEAGLLESARQAVGELEVPEQEPLVRGMDAKLAMNLLHQHGRNRHVAIGDGHKGRGSVDAVLDRLEKALKRYAPDASNGAEEPSQ